MLWVAWVERRSWNHGHRAANNNAIFSLVSIGLLVLRSTKDVDVCVARVFGMALCFALRLAHPQTDATTTANMILQRAINWCIMCFCFVMPCSFLLQVLAVLWVVLLSRPLTATHQFAGGQEQNDKRE